MLQDNVREKYQHPVVEQFFEICGVPRCSGHCEMIGAYLLAFAEKNGLNAVTDDIGNIMILHPGSEDTGIILQCHQDMVPAIDEGTEHDFTKDSIEYIIKDGRITADGTSLGADDGTGIAMCLYALIDPSLKDKGFRCIFTVDEETTMEGAKNLESSWMNGSKYLINLDDESSNEIVIGSAGSARIVSESDLVPLGNKRCFSFNVSGLFGGHSGTDIDKGRANAIILTAEFLDSVKGLELSSISGGSAYNAIPASCSAVFSCSDDFDIIAYFNEFYPLIKKRYSSTDPDMAMSLSDAGNQVVHDGIQSKDLIKCVLQAPFGVLKSTSEGVITSSNTGVISTNGNEVNVTFMVRSAEDPDLINYTNRIKNVFESVGASADLEGSMSGWLENEDTALIDKARSVMTDVFDSPTNVCVIHAGLECGEMKNKCPSILAISIGPTVMNPHSTSEYTEIDSIEMTWDAVHRIISEGI